MEKLDPIERQLLENVYVDIDADAPRSVYADWLLERGDSRGDFIALSLQKPSTATGRKLEKLRRAHAAEWLGPLADFIELDQVEFTRGFLSSARLKTGSTHYIAEPQGKRALDKLRAVLADHRWRTLESLELGLSDDDACSVLDAPTLSNLREVSGITVGALAKLATGKPRSLRAVDVTCALTTDRTEQAALRKLAALPELREIKTCGLSDYASERRECAWLVKGRAREQLRVLRLSCYDVSGLPAMLADLQRFEALERVDFEGDELTLDNDDRLSVLTSDRTPTQMLELLEDYPKKLLTRVRVPKGGKARKQQLRNRKITDASLADRVAALGAKLEFVR